MAVSRRLGILLAVLGATCLLWLTAGKAIERRLGFRPVLRPAVPLPPLPPNARRGIIKVDGETRGYVVYTPASYDGSKSVPAVFAFHGAGGSAQIPILYYGLKEKADEAGFILVSPDAPREDRRWEWLSAKGGHKTRDMAFFEALLDKLERGFKVDPDRVYVTGHSSGGMMAHRLGVEFSDRIAAIAPVEGTIARKAAGGNITIPDAKGPVSVLIIHGMRDETIPYGPAVDGKLAGDSNAAPETAPDPLTVAGAAAFWVKQNGCRPAPAKETGADGNVVTHVWSGGRNGTEVKVITILRGGHGWPGAPPPWNSNQDVKAGAAIWDFFAKHPRRAAQPAVESSAIMGTDASDHGQAGAGNSLP